MITDEFKSRSQKKRDAEDVEKMVVELIELSPAQISGLPCDAELKEEISAAKQITERVARKRQIKYVAKLLRETDIKPLMEVLDDTKGLRIEETRQFKELERLRNRILRDETGEALEQTSRMAPALDTEGVKHLVEAYRKTGQKRFSREIFQQIKSAFNKSRG